MNIINLIAGAACLITVIWAFSVRERVAQFSKKRAVAFIISVLFCLFMGGLNCLTAYVAFGFIAPVITILAVGTGWAIIYRKGW